MASLNFPESELVAEIYAQALQAAGIPVRRELNLGTRELLQPALREGLVDVVPEYVGSALSSLSPHGQVPAGVSANDTGELRAALGRALRPWHVYVLSATPAQDQNTVVITRSRAARDKLRTVSDLVRRGPLVLAAPPECPTRPYCLPGLRRVYGMDVSRLIPYDTESQRAAALQQGVADAALMFSTDGRLATGDFVALKDDRHLQPADNIVPLVREAARTRYGSRLVDTVNRVSARLTQRALTFLNWRVDVAGKPIAAEATGWLQREGLLPRAR